MQVLVGRWTVGAMVALALLGGCGNKKEAAAKADARAANFVPPSVTSRLDYGSNAERRFHVLDRNGDDRLTPDELPKANAPRIMAFDRNHDGVVTAIEYSDGMMARFDRGDLNHDGTLTSEERQAALAQ